MHFFRTLVISALLCASAASAATVPVGGWAGENDVEITVKIHHERPISEGAAIGVSERLVFFNSNQRSPVNDCSRALTLMSFLLLVYLAL